MLTTKQATLARQAFAEFRHVQMPEGGMDDRDLRSLLDDQGIVESTISLADRSAAGFTRNGMAVLSRLGADLLAGRTGPPIASARVLGRALSKLATAQWRSRPACDLSDDDVRLLSDAVEAWFQDQERMRTHYVPCTLSAWPVRAFAVGPVRFYPLGELPVEDFGLSRSDVWPGGGAMTGMAEILLGEGIFRLAEARHAGTVAEVTVRGREQARSELAADLSIDVAIAAVQMLTPPRFFSRAARATARNAPVWWATLVRDGEQVRPGVNNDEPGRSMGPGGLEVALAMQKPQLQSMGRRLDGFLAGDGETPVLDEAWCNAAFWYHEAAAEPLDTVAIAKFETAIEVLFRSVSASGSKRRLVDAMEALLGLPRDKPLPSGVTPDQFAASIVTARSRVLHGTWPTLHTELPATDGGAGLGDAELLARLLLIAFSLRLDAYQAAGLVGDSVEALLAWTPPTA